MTTEVTVEGRRVLSGSFELYETDEGFVFVLHRTLPPNSPYEKHVCLSGADAHSVGGLIMDGPEQSRKLRPTFAKIAATPPPIPEP